MKSEQREGELKANNDDLLLSKINALTKISCNLNAKDTFRYENFKGTKSAAAVVLYMSIRVLIFTEELKALRENK
jgi:hypothetical protein